MSGLLFRKEAMKSSRIGLLIAAMVVVQGLHGAGVLEERKRSASPTGVESKNAKAEKGKKAAEEEAQGDTGAYFVITNSLDYAATLSITVKPDPKHPKVGDNKMIKVISIPANTAHEFYFNDFVGGDYTMSVGKSDDFAGTKQVRSEVFGPGYMFEITLTEVGDRIFASTTRGEIPERLQASLVVLGGGITDDSWTITNETEFPIVVKLSGLKEYLSELPAGPIPSKKAATAHLKPHNPGLWDSHISVEVKPAADAPAGIATMSFEIPWHRRTSINVSLSKKKTFKINYSSPGQERTSIAGIIEED